MRTFEELNKMTVEQLESEEIEAKKALAEIAEKRHKLIGRVLHLHDLIDKEIKDATLKVREVPWAYGEAHGKSLGVAVGGQDVGDKSGSTEPQKNPVS